MVLTTASARDEYCPNGARRYVLFGGGSPNCRPRMAEGGKAMGIFLSKRELAQTEPAEKLDFKSPVPTRMVSNGEFNPLPQTRRQRQFEERLKDLSEASVRKLGMDRRQFLRTSCGMAVAV